LRFDEFVKSQKINLLSFRRNRLCRNWPNDAERSFRHSGLDPESIAFPEYCDTGCRIKSGMTKSDFLRDHQIWDLPFDLAQGGESFDFAQDREPVERLVEPYVI
jgi:hypothetical protein